MMPERCDVEHERCQLCGDDAVVGTVTHVDTVRRTASVAFADTSVDVALDFVDAGVGDRVLVHMGFAIERLVPT